MRKISTIIKRWEPEEKIDKADLERVTKSVFRARQLSAASIKKLEEEGIIIDLD